MPEHYELRHARWRPRLPERGTWRRGARVKRGHEDAEAGGGTGLRDATTARPASWASRNSSPPVMDAQTEGKQRQERRREARKERRTSMPGIVLARRAARPGGGRALRGLQAGVRAGWARGGDCPLRPTGLLADRSRPLARCRPSARAGG